VSDIDVYKEWLGIPEGQRPPDYYTLLRLVQFEDDIEKIRENYRKLNNHVRKYATGQYLVESQELLNELAKAMLCLTDPDGKQEYDESLGRETTTSGDDAPATVLDFLVRNELLSRSQVSEVEHFADARGLSIRDAVIQMKLVEPPDAARALAAELRMSFVDLDDMLPEDSVLDRVPRRTVKRYSCLPLFEDRGRLLVACADEPSVELEDEIRMRFGVPMRSVLALPRSINQAIARYYAPGMRDEVQEDSAAVTAEKKSGGKSKTKSKSAPSKPKRSAQLTDAEKSDRMKLSLIIVCWSIIGTMGVCYFLNGQRMEYWHAGLGVLMGGAAFGFLKLTYWK
jgi:hypothetical protein